MSIFEAFETPKDLRAQYETSPCTAGVMGLKTLNVICGPNNSGKSRLLRSLFVPRKSAGHVFFRTAEADRGAVQRQAVNLSRSMFNEMHARGFPRNYVEEIQRLAEPADKLDATLRLLLGDSSLDPHVGLDRLNGFGFDVPKWRAGLVEASVDHDFDAFAYVPAIRSCRNLGADDSIFQHVNKRYFSEQLSAARCYGGQELFQRVRGLLLGKPSQRQQVRHFEELLSKEFFDGREVSLSPREDGGYDELYIRIEPEPERAVSKLGDGLQSIIIQLAPAFLSEGKSLALFIEEPELYLHPGLQRRLFEVLLDLDKHTHWERHQVFVTSHSNHLLDLTLDHERVAILRVEKTVGDRSDDQVLRATAEEDAKFKVEMVAPGEIRLLHDLGVQSSSVFLSNCTIWVEGPTDRTIIRHYMELIAKRDKVELREDLDFSFVYYAGSLAERLSLLDEDGPDVDRMCSRMFFVADGDIEGKGDRVDRLREKLGERFHLLQCREVENTVSAGVLREVIAAWYGNKASELALPKAGDIPGSGLGTLIMEGFDGFLKNEKWAAEDGGLVQRRKTRFADMVREHTKTVADLSPAALAVAEAAVEFVHNHRAAANTPAS